MKVSNLGEYDLYLFHNGTNFHTYEMLGAHFTEQARKKSPSHCCLGFFRILYCVEVLFQQQYTRVHRKSQCRSGGIVDFFNEGAEVRIFKYDIEPS